MAPEQSTVEVLIGGAYRKLVTRKQDSKVNLENIRNLPSELGETNDEEDAWRALFNFGGLGSPSTESRDLPQVVQLVPMLANYGGVLGRVRNRWSPGNLLVNAIQSGSNQQSCSDEILENFARSLLVDKDDDFLAKFLENSLYKLSGDEYPEIAKAYEPVFPAYREQVSRSRSPAERLVLDLPHVIRLKAHLTRRQWTLLLEALLRIGLFAHYAWLLSLNAQTWEVCREIINGASRPTLDKIRADFWERHAKDYPILELGQDSGPAIKKSIRKYAQARLGLSLVLRVLQEVGCEANPLQHRGGVETPVVLEEFFSLVAEKRDAIKTAFEPNEHLGSFEAALGAVLDRTSGFQSATTGPTRNLLFFLRYTAGRISPRVVEQVSYDQSYLLEKADRSRRNSPWLVDFGPVLIVTLVHCCCRQERTRSVSVNRFERYLADWGIRASQRELTTGKFAKLVEQLGIMVDSPDAGGGRLLMDPLMQSSKDE
ncbi:hypothetical protein ACFQ3C_03850 [Seohaeicola saemankumensis]|uniref:Uncharacterized protein n=1 Tax=Seohaeicola saemankumensis TaxID=481181 RepID=A0ABW3T9C0_9RHOB